MDSGWRRCGTHIYKPDNRITCCPAYTIRCDAEQFRISRAQKRVLRTVNKFLLTGEKPVDADNAAAIASTDCRGDCPENNFDSSMSRLNFNSLASGDSEISTQPVSSMRNSGRSGSARKKRWQALQDRMQKRAQTLGIPYDEVFSEYLLRRKRRLEKNKPKELEELLDSGSSQEGAAHFIDIRLCRSSPKSDEFDRTFQQEFDLYKAYQVKIHKDDPNRITPRSFEEFLVSSPLTSKRNKQANSAGAPQFGSYHQQYWLDGNKLIAVGVIDLVPGCLSSVYLFYDPEYAFLHLGTYSALREIAFIRHLQRSYSRRVSAYADFTQYYMGYYIHSCVKMRYKGAFSPSYLVCPETNTWVPIERCKRLLDVQKYARFAEDNSTTGSSSSHDSTDSIVIMLPYSTRCALMLPSSSYTVEGDRIVTTLGAASTILSRHGLEIVKEWRRLVTSTGSMRIDFR
ncbi:unnamed protein product [Rodentolepis nana]|uniref:Arginyl-tRNA--protein transferase 1 n=1 Tax=Rodentolepis nana TaxID=102285 RepID=A0A0R3T3N4_RODNA|nr:unnamed protein product [Rodentolepis nana]